MLKYSPLPLSTDSLRGLVAGALGGLFASAVMNNFQALAAPLLPPSDAPPATEVAADKLAIAAAGVAVPDKAKPAAGNAVHYGFGAALGAAYGLAAEWSPAVTAGAGTGFGAAAAGLFDEIAVPALRLSPPPAETPAGLHLYGVISHLVYGVALEASRRLLRGA